MNIELKAWENMLREKLEMVSIEKALARAEVVAAGGKVDAAAEARLVRDIELAESDVHYCAAFALADLLKHAAKHG